MKHFSSIYKKDRIRDWRDNTLKIYQSREDSVLKHMIIWLIENTDDKRQFNYYLKKFNLIESSKIERDRFFKLNQGRASQKEFKKRFCEEYLKLKDKFN